MIKKISLQPYVMSNIISFDFNIWEYKDDELNALASLLFSPLLEELHIAPLAIESLNETIAKNYHQLSYHNFRHAIDVCQFIYVLMQKRALDPFLSSWEKFALLTAALCHDIGHTGRDNAYQLAHKTALYEKYGSNSPLEKFHLDTTLDILRESDQEIFSSLPEETMPLLLQKIGEWILSTDITKHDEWIEKIERADSLTSSLCGVLVLKAADLSQYTRPEPVRKIWEEKILDELFHQAQEENPSENRESFKKAFLQKQREFFEKKTRPLMEVLSDKLKMKLPKKEM
jgi:hypothetical protein